MQEVGGNEQGNTINMPWLRKTALNVVRYMKKKETPDLRKIKFLA